MTQPPAAKRMEELNRHCHFIGLDPDRLAARLDWEHPELHALIRNNQPHLFSASPLFITREHVRAMQRVISAVEEVARLPGYRDTIGPRLPEIARVDHGPSGVFFGWDFHLGASGPQLIEINTNAGGALLNVALARAQRGCCSAVESLMNGPHDLEGIEKGFVEMFQREWRAQRGGTPLERVAIVDDEPEGQYLYPDFLLFQQMFTGAGLDAVIADPRELTLENGVLHHAGERIDLVYNRLTDFYLEAEPHRALREAYRSGGVVLTPHPRAYGLLADKRNLALLSDPDGLRRIGARAEAIEILAAGIPRTVRVSRADADALWARRNQLFFKPATGFGSRAAYRGAKLTRKTWAAILAGDYVAQELVPPSERTIQLAGTEVPLKVDVRNYAYRGEVQLLAARLYQGQTTNFRTPGGGFAPVYTEAAGDRATGPAA